MDISRRFNRFDAVSVMMVLFGVTLLGLALLGDLVRHRPFDFGDHQQQVAFVGAVLLAEGALRLRTGEPNGLWRLLISERRSGFTLAFAFALAIVAIQIAAYRRLFVDDAFITFRYSQNLARGLGFTWNPGEKPVEGYSNFLWMLLNFVAERAHLDPMTVSRSAGAVCLVVSLVAVRALARIVTGSARWANLAILQLAAYPQFAYWAMSGLETASVSMFSLLYFVSFHHDFPSRRWPWRTALCAVLLWLSRPDPALLLVLSGLPVLFSHDRESRGWLLRLVLLALPIVAIYQGWKLVTFGRLFPNTVAAKWSPLAGTEMAMGYLQLAFPLLLLALLGAQRGASLFLRQMLLVGFGVLLALVNAKSQVGHFGRHYLLVLAPLTALLPVTLARWERERNEPAALLGGPAAGAFALLLLVAAAPLRSMQIYANQEVAGYRTAHIPLADRLKRDYPPSALLAASDCGILPYRSGLRTMDLWGLTDRYIAEHGFDPKYVLGAAPEAIVLHSTDPEEFRGREIYDLELYPALQARGGYRHTGTYEFYGYWLWLFTRESPRPGA